MLLYVDDYALFLIMEVMKTLLPSILKKENIDERNDDEEVSGGTVVGKSSVGCEVANAALCCSLLSVSNELPTNK